MMIRSRQAVPRQYEFYTRCCDDEPGLDDREKGEAIQAMQERAWVVSYKTMQRNCAGLLEWEAQMGYGRRGTGLRLEDDWAVRFRKSRYRGARCFYIQHSRIEHIFVHRDDLDRIGEED